MKSNRTVAPKLLLERQRRDDVAVRNGAQQQRRDGAAAQEPEDAVPRLAID